jgi:hypothetical protein
MANLTELPRAKMLRLVRQLDTDDAALASVQALVDCLTINGIISSQQFYECAADRMEEALKARQSDG